MTAVASAVGEPPTPDPRALPCRWRPGPGLRVCVGRVDSPRRATLPTHTRTAAWIVREVEHGSRLTTPWPVFLLDFTGTELRSPPSGPHNRNVPPPAPAASARSAEKARTPGSPDTGNQGNTRTH